MVLAPSLCKIGHSSAAADEELRFSRAPTITILPPPACQGQGAKALIGLTKIILGDEGKIVTLAFVKGIDRGIRPSPNRAFASFTECAKCNLQKHASPCKAGMVWRRPLAVKRTGRMLLVLRFASFERV